MREKGGEECGRGGCTSRCLMVGTMAKQQMKTSHENVTDRRHEREDMSANEEGGWLVSRGEE
ncbi:Uncharacterized protein APZ42_013119 [Daphnia magna]|uniref:Uncharacterized protein n=1 Tax=Daphnia magna TaxID=35525 RepID=A0A162R5F3_9CRUS|nr:Uncharacterized protein APZ42_013119 [Daphnia magna]